MKLLKILLMAVGILILAPAVADDNLVFCLDMKELTIAIGELRYDGEPLEEVLAILTHKDEDLEDLGEEVAEAVYALPDYPTKQAQQQAIQNFAEEVFQACMR